MDVDVAALQRENAELRALVEKLMEQLAQMNERVAELLAIAQRRQRKATAKAPPAQQPPPSLAGDARQSFDDLRAAPR